MDELKERPQLDTLGCMDPNTDEQVYQGHK